MLASALLIAIVLGPILAHRRTRELRTEIAELYMPARDYIDDAELALVRSMSALRGFVITGDERFLADYRAARAAGVGARRQIELLSGRLGPEQAREIETMRRTTERWRGRIAAHLAERQAAPPGGAEGIPLEADLYERARTATDRAEAAISEALERNWERIAVLDERHLLTTVVLTLLALFAVLIMGWVAGQIRRLARQLERRAREEVAARGLARDLAAAARPDRVTEIAAEGVHVLTGSAGVFIERAYSPEQPVEVVAVAGHGAPPLHTRVPYPGSLTEQMIETGEPEFFTAVRDITGPIAANLARSCGDCGVLVIPLGPLRAPLGALVLLRGPGQRPLRAEEIGRIRILADFTSLALRRALLVVETERRRQEAEENRERYQSLFMYSPDAIIELAPDGSVVRANHAATRISGYSRQELIDLDWFSIIARKDWDLLRTLFRKTLGGKPQSYELSFVRKGGRQIEAQVTQLPVVVGGRVIGVFSISEDITERKRAEAALRETNQRLEAVIQASPLAIIVLDAEGRVRRWNPAAREIFGWTEQEVLGGPPPIVHPDRAAEFRRYHAQAMRGQPSRGVEIRRRRKDGTQLTLRLSTAALRDAQGRINGALGVLEDITERKRAEEVLRQTTETLETLVEASPLAIIVHDFNDTVRLWNPAAERIFGWKAEEVVGRKLPIIPPEEWEIHREGVRRGFEGESFTGEEVTGVRKDGTRVPLSLATSPLRGADGRIGNIVVMLFDITRRQRAEAERRGLLERERIARAEAEHGREELERVMRSKERLIRGFSHDLKNPLGAVAGFAELLESGAKGALAPEQRESISRIRKASRSMLDMIEDLVELSRAEAGRITLECEPTDPAELVRDSAEEHRAEAKSAGLALRVEAAPDLPAVTTDRTRVHQILGNLLSNATKYTPAGGCVTVRAEFRADGRAPHPGRWLAVDVRDTGPGIPPEMHERIFEEFARLAPGAPQGTGLGLAISRRIARILGGDITVESEVGQGSTFTLWLPLGRGAPPAAP